MNYLAQGCLFGRFQAQEWVSTEDERSLLNRVPCVPCVPFNLLVPSCPNFRRALVPSMLACPRALVPACPNFRRALVPSMLACPRALVPACPNYRRALVPSMLACPRAQIIGVPSCLQCWRALVPSCPRACMPKFSVCPRACVTLKQWITSDMNLTTFHLF